jgi:hypothetical protein
MVLDQLFHATLQVVVPRSGPINEFPPCFLGSHFDGGGENRFRLMRYRFHGYKTSDRLPAINA